MHSCPNICKLLDILETEGYISRLATFEMKEYLLGKFKMINDIRSSDIDEICTEIRKSHSSNEILDNSWLTGEFKEYSYEIMLAIIVDEALMKMDFSNHSTIMKLLILIHDRLMFTKAS